MSKGIALPVEYLVILIIAVIVLLAVILFFVLGWDPFGLYLEKAKQEACGILTRNRCAREALGYEVPNLDIYPRNGILDRDDNGAEHTVQEVCNVYLHKDPATGTEQECLSACGCA